MSRTGDDERFMAEALALGARGLGLTTPNPAVGAVLVADGEVVGRGWHRRAGGPHAEVRALADAERSGAASRIVGSTIYVTLEPCSTTGRTPPCVQAIIDAGIGRVVVGVEDLNPAHAGAGFGRLREAGVEVEVGVLRPEAEDLIRFFRSRVSRGRPWVIAKSAITLDGRTTLAAGEGQWISCPESREDVQRWRRQCDAILVGGETLRRDDPMLTLRGEFARDREQPLRVVVTGEEELPEESRLLTDEHSDRTRIYRKVSLAAALGELAGEGVNAVLLESGGRLLGHALDEGLVDEVILYVAPRLGGGASRILPGDPIGARLEGMEAVSIGTDIRIRGRVRPLDEEA